MWQIVWLVLNTVAVVSGISPVSRRARAGCAAAAGMSAVVVPGNSNSSGTKRMSAQRDGRRQATATRGECDWHAAGMHLTAKERVGCSSTPAVSSREASEGCATVIVVRAVDRTVRVRLHPIHVRFTVYDVILNIVLRASGI